MYIYVIHKCGVVKDSCSTFFEVKERIMTTWLQIALAALGLLANLTGPVNTWTISTAKSRHVPRPATNQRASLSLKLAGWFNRLFPSPFIIPSLNILYNAFLVFRLMHHGIFVVTNRFVFDMCLSFGVIVWSFGWMKALSLDGATEKHLDQLEELIIAMADVQGELVTLLETNRGVIDGIQTNLGGIVGTIEGLAEAQSNAVKILNHITGIESRPAPAPQNAKPQRRRSR